MTTTEQFRAAYPDHVMGRVRELAVAHLANLEKLLTLLPKNPHGLEIGCFKGGTTRWLLEHGMSHMTVVDTFEGSPEHEGLYDRRTIWADFLKNTQTFDERITVRIGQSVEQLPTLLMKRNEFDFIYVDASHDSRDVILDAELSWRMLRKNGILLFDDYGWLYHDDPYRNPKPAIDFFLACHAQELRVIDKGYQCSAQKL